jgi:hypothetical protein
MRVQHVAQTARSWPRGTKDDLQQGDLLSKKIERIRWRLWHGRVQGALDLIDEILEELKTPKRQIQLTAVYLKKLTGVLRDLETDVSGIHLDHQLCRRTAFGRTNLDGTNRKRGSSAAASADDGEAANALVAERSSLHAQGTDCHHERDI